MTASKINGICLPDETKAIVWRIFGAGESPLTERSTFDLIDPIICAYVSPSTQRNWVVTVIRGWFETIGERRYLKPDVREPVAELILEGVGADRSETAIWAIGSIDADLAASLIRSCWSHKEINSFIDAALKALEKIAGRDDVLNADGIAPFAEVDAGKARIPKDAVRREGRLETFQHLTTHGFDLVHYALHPPAGNLIELVIGLGYERFESLIERLDHPVMQARTAYHMIAATRASDHRKPLLWITKHSCDALIALAIVYMLETVNRLDEDIRSFARLAEDRPVWSTELRPPQDDLDAAAFNLLNDLIDQLSTLDPLVCTRWIGELLSAAPYALIPRGVSEKHPRVDQLERLGMVRLANVVTDSWTDDFLPELCAGLCLTPRTTWTRHVADVAWEVRDAEPARATSLARAALDEHGRRVAQNLDDGHLFLNWDDWHDREWIAGLGKALVLSSNEINLFEWVSARCQALPLSVWDAEENYQAFSAADRAAQIWFLAALHAFAYLKQIERAVDPAEVLDFAETVWIHCNFVGQYLPDGAKTAVVAECAARSAVEFGDANDLWILKQAAGPVIGPRALWALIDQQKKKAAREGRSVGACDEIVVDEVALAASPRFGKGGQFGFESLHYWGRLWLLLCAVEQARLTAKAILTFPMRGVDRSSKVLILELLTLGADEHRLDQQSMDSVRSTYRELWPAFGYTPEMERADRHRIDELLGRTGFAVS